MDSRDLLFFTTVAEELHFARAAARLYIVPATVTQRVRALEAELGVALFERTSRRVALTPAGRRLLEPARAILDGLDAMADLARSLALGSAGHVRVGLAPNLGTIGARFTADLLARLPGLETVGESMWSSQALDAVTRGDIAAAVVRGPIDRPGLDLKFLGSHHDGFVALAPDDPLATQQQVSVQDFQARPFLITERSLAPTVHDGTVAFFAAHGVAPIWRHHRLMGYEQIAPFVAAGYAATLVHSTLVHPHRGEVDLPGVRVLPLVEAAPSYEVAVAWRQNERSPLAATLARWTPSGQPRTAAARSADPAPIAGPVKG